MFHLHQFLLFIRAVSDCFKLRQFMCETIWKRASWYQKKKINTFKSLIKERKWWFKKKSSCKIKSEIPRNAITFTVQRTCVYVRKGSMRRVYLLSPLHTHTIFLLPLLPCFPLPLPLHTSRTRADTSTLHQAHKKTDPAEPATPVPLSLAVLSRQPLDIFPNRCISYPSLLRLWCDVPFWSL